MQRHLVIINALVAAALLAGCREQPAPVAVETQPQPPVEVETRPEAPVAVKTQPQAPIPAPEASLEPADPAVTFFNVGIKSANYEEVLNQFRPRNEFNPPNQSSPAIDLILHVATEKYNLVSVNRAIIESFTDKNGQDLSLGMTQATGRLFFPADNAISLDHKHGFIGVRFPKPPSNATERLTMRGTILARHGGNEQTLTFPDIPFQKGSKFRVLAHDYTLSDIFTYDSQPDRLNFSITSDGSYDEIRAFRFLSADGKQVVGTVTRVDRNVREPTRLLCRLTGDRPEAMTIEVDTFESPSDLAIPFQLNLDLGALSTHEPSRLTTTASLPPAPPGNSIKSQSRVLALTMTTPISERQGTEWFGERSSVVNFRRPGLNMQVLVHVPNHKMVRLSTEAGTPLALTDDTGTSLLAGASVIASSDQSAMREIAPISRDGHHALITVATNSLPAKGAKAIHFKGRIGVVMEESEKIVEARNVSLLPGTTFSAGDVEMQVLSVRAAGAAGNGMYLTLSTTKPVRGTLVLLDANNRQLATMPIIQDRFSGPEGGSEVTFTLAKAIENATIQLKSANESDAVAVPVEFTVPIGLGEKAPG